MVAVYGILGLFQLMNPLTHNDHLEVYDPMAMITIFSMMFVTLISFLNIRNTSKLC